MSLFLSWTPSESCGLDATGEVIHDALANAPQEKPKLADWEEKP
jgi:hypothetical protein